MVCQKIEILKQPVDRSITVPGSKSITNRALLIAALAQGQSVLSGVLFSDDTLAALSALQALGINIEVDQQRNQCLVTGAAGQFLHRYAQLYCHESGTLTRFLIPMLATCPGQYHISAAERMMVRPLKNLLQILAQQGCRFDFESQSWQMPFTLVTEGLSGGLVEVELQHSSQFLSGLLMAAPYAKAPLTIRAESIAKKPYVAMTIEMMSEFGIVVSQQQQEQVVFDVPIAQYQSRHYTIEPDASTASYFFAVAALTGGRIQIKHFFQDGLQGDVKFLALLVSMGCQVETNDIGTTIIGPSNLSGLGTISMAGFSDTFMTVAALAVFADSPTTMTDLSHTRLQESDRVAAMASELTKLGIQVNTTEDSLTIYPGQPAGTTVSGHNDHRIAMSLALIGLKVPDVVIDGAQCVAKTCPDYFDRLALLA